MRQLTVGVKRHHVTLFLLYYLTGNQLTVFSKNINL